MTLRYVLITKFCAESGYSEKAYRLPELSVRPGFVARAPDSALQ